jgi:hypothetical protein
LSQVIQVHTNTASVNQNAAVYALPGGIHNDIKSTLLTRTPDIGGFTS